MYIAAGQGQTTPGDKILMSTETSCPIGHLLQVSKNLFEVWFYTIFFFHDFIQVYSPEAGADNPLETKFWCQQEHLVTSVICCKFQNNLFEVWFHTFFSWVYTCIWPRGWGRQPPGDKVLMSTKMSCLFIHLLQVSKKCLWSLILYIFYSWFNTCI